MNMLKSKKKVNNVLERLISNMVYVEGGTFTMGATPEQGADASEGEKPAHKVTLSPFYICKFEVTQDEYCEVMGDCDSYFEESGDLPVESITWNLCQLFIEKLNEKTGMNFRLPTEAEWEFAARGGNKSRGYKYAGSDNIDEVAWYGVDEEDGGSTHEVGLKKPNELGLYDMSGNVLEFCQNWMYDYDEEYETDPSTDPDSGSYQEGNSHPRRGGSFSCPAENCRVSARSGDYNGYGVDDDDVDDDFNEMQWGDMGNYCGFRLAHPVES